MVGRREEDKGVVIRGGREKDNRDQKDEED